MARSKKADDKNPVIIIRRARKGNYHPPHSTAWKVAYADFVTAMMAFFLLLWLLNVTTDEQKLLIASYFAPSDPRVAEVMSGSGGVMAGRSMAEEGAMVTDVQPVISKRDTPTSGIGKDDGEDGTKQHQISEERLSEEIEKHDQKIFKETEKALREALESFPDLKELSQNLLIDMTPEGLRIQIVDQEGKPMFELGSAKPLPQAETLLRLIARVVKDLPNRISIRGHTDSRQYGDNAAYTNWELSADRSNASRRIMLDGGLNIIRIENVQGKADHDPLVVNDPLSAKNRRISIILMKQSLTPGVKKPPTGPQKPLKPEMKKQEEGVIYFP